MSPGGVVTSKYSMPGFIARIVPVTTPASRPRRDSTDGMGDVTREPESERTERRNFAARRVAGYALNEARTVG